ncbi:TraB/GumN family protein [Halonatronum saccharophilum]|uniref:TraB/GumN family protein n=1 Tax=Halonatronum saccharophilum TaxID=150060 RepID=UPI0004807DE6|nr:TraB/GumN family protein [Halonatronum saccharophilum]
MKISKSTKLKKEFILILTLFALLTLLGSTISAQEGDNFLWEVSSENNRVYILGSIHLAKKDIYPLDPIIEESFNRSDYLVIEANIQDIDESLMQQFVLQRGLYMDGSNLRSNISKDLYDQVLEEGQKYGLDPFQLNFMRPWLISVTLEMLRFESLGYKAEYGIDNYFITKATNNKEIIELESAEFQLEMLSSFSPKLQEMALKSTIENGIFAEEIVEILFDYWLRGDTKGLEKLLFKDRIENPELEEFYFKVFDQRNYTMTDKILKYLEDENDYFVIVGAGHLIGEAGIINLLKKTGYSPKQL